MKAAKEAALLVAVLAYVMCAAPAAILGLALFADRIVKSALERCGQQ